MASSAVRFSAIAHSDNATAVGVRVFYKRGDTDVDLAKTQITLPAARAPISLDLTPCLNDARSSGTADGCGVSAELTLLRGAVELDGAVVGPVTVHPGETVAMPTVTLYEVATVDVLPASGGKLTAEPETTVVLTAVPRDRTGSVLSGQSVIWSSGNQGVASIDGTGVLTTLVPGVAPITAMIGGRVGQATFQVVPFAARRILVNPHALSVTVGTTAPLSTSVFDRKNRVLSGRQITWTSSNSNIATASSSGSVRGVSPGVATITATVDDVSDAADVSVSNGVVSSVSVSFATQPISVGQSAQASAAGQDSSGLLVPNRVVSAWRSSNNSVATVSPTGLVTGVALGTAVISATIDGVVGQSTILVVSAPVASVRVALPTSSLIVGQIVQATASPRDANDNPVTAPVTWSSSNSGVASVSQSGLVAAVAVGTVEISASAGGKSGSATLSVAQATGLVLNVAGGGAGSGIVASNTGGISCSISGGTTSGSCTSVYQPGASVQLTATLGPNSTFAGWSGAPGCGPALTCAVTMSQALTVTATFGVAVVMWNVSTSASPSTSGSTTGGGTYANGAQVTVNATANTGFAFSNWTENGTVVSSLAGYTFTASANRALVANFLPTFTLTVLSSGDFGTISSNPPGINCPSTTTGPPCVAPFRSGQTVTLTAAPQPVSRLFAWSGDCSGSGLTCTVTMTQARFVAAEFLVYQPPTLSPLSVFTFGTSPSCPGATLYQLQVSFTNNFGPLAMTHASIGLSWSLGGVSATFGDAWSGTNASGTLITNTCVVFGAATSGTFILTLSNGSPISPSNPSSVTVTKPAGAP